MSSVKAIAAFSISTQFENIGDAWIHRELIRLVDSRVQTWIDISRCPPQFAASLDLDSRKNSIQVNGFLALLHRILRHRLRGGRVYYFLGPGGRFGELEGIAILRAWVNSIMLGALWLIGVRICLVGTSYERFGPRMRQITVWRSKLLHRHLVRDKQSLHYSEGFGVRVNGVIPDLAFATPKNVRSSPSKTLQIALSFRGDQSSDQEELVFDFVRQLAMLAPPTAAWRAVAQVERDYPIAKAVASMLRGFGYEASVHQVADNFQRAEASYVGSTHVIGNRLHALLLGSSVGSLAIPVIDLTLNAKILGTFKDLDRGSSVINIRDSEAAALAAAHLEAVRQPPLSFDSYRQEIELAFNEFLGPPSQARTG